MSTYSVAGAKNRLPSLIDKTLEGEVAELRPRRQVGAQGARAITEWLISRRHKGVGITSVVLLDQIYEEDDQR